MLTEALPRLSLTYLPTPLEELSRLHGYMGTGPRLFIKRDDLTSLGGGGNKIRKLEFLLADAQERGAEVIITTGAIQSNHCRQTAAAAARLGLTCILVLRGEAPSLWNGNLLLDELYGADIHWTNGNSPASIMARLQAEIQRDGRSVYSIPVGGSNALGAAGYVDAMEELAGQLQAQGISQARIVLASGSGGTQAGVLVGAKALGLPLKVEGMDNRGSVTIQQDVRHLAQATAALLRLDLSFQDEDFIFHTAGGNYPYGTVTVNERSAIRLLARTEGILLDPVYGGRAFGEMIRRLRGGSYAADEALIFWHTGGLPGLFGHAAHLLSPEL